jgi:hypothetical protein
MVAGETAAEEEPKRRRRRDAMVAVFLGGFSGSAMGDFRGGGRGAFNVLEMGESRDSLGGGSR